MMLRLVKIVCDLMTSDDHDIVYLLEMGLKSFYHRILEWNNSHPSHFCQEIEQHICLILTNLVASNTQDFGTDLLVNDSASVVEYFLKHLTEYNTSASQAKFKQQVVDFFVNLVSCLSGDAKDVLLFQFNIIPITLQNLRHETN